MPIALNSTSIGRDDADKCLLMLHGIYGRGRNWASIAKSLTAARPEYRCVLLDLPYHGDSGAGHHGQTVTGLAADVIDWLAGESLAPSAILGHSLGGKVALAMADSLRDRQVQLWVVDSTPEASPPSGGAWALLQSVRELPETFASREALVEALVAKGWAAAVAQWMATNLARGQESFTWQLDFDVMERLMVSFAETDLWPVLDDPETPHVFHMISATTSGVVSAPALARLDAIGPPRVHVHRLDGGHWIHSERPADVVGLLVDHLA